MKENYVKNNPRLASEVTQDSRVKQLETLNLLYLASDSMSEGDLLDKSIHRDGNWSLMPSHCVLSTVRPCFYAHGHSWQEGSWSPYGFPA